MIRRYHVVAVVALALAAALVSFTVYRYLARAPVASVGEALVGGPFTLTDHTGKRVSDADFRGRYLLIAFGYTYCPDLCPAELQVMSAALDRLGAEAEKITPVFVTIDPARDTVQVLAEYMQHFHPRFVGLTGSEDEIAAVARAYRVYYAKAKDSGTGGDYLMDHSTIIYLMGPDGKFVKHFTYGADAGALADNLRAATGG